MGFNDVNVNRIYPLIFQRSELENDLFFKGKSPCLSSINGPEGNSERLSKPPKAQNPH